MGERISIKKKHWPMILQNTGKTGTLWKRTFLRVCCVLIVSGILVTIQSEMVEAASNKKNLPKVFLNENGLSTSRECGKCHKDIYSTWKKSLHAQVKENAVFWTAYLQAFYDNAEKAQTLCLSCHAPVAIMNKDLNLTRKLSREGVNCDFCHSISDIHRENKQFKYEHEFGLMKQGPLKNVESPVHKTKFNRLYQQSQFCASCHEYKTDAGVKIIETYSEWEQSPYYKEGTHCQDCHMRKIKGKIVDTKIAETPENKISSHNIAGGHSLAMRDKSLEIQISAIERLKQKLMITVDITNQGAGHKIPTGLPSKKLTLKVAVQSGTGTILQTQKKVYQKSLVDRYGVPVIKDSDIMMGKGTRIVSDNRLSPRETRREQFMFFIPEGEGKKISATVYYSHQPEIIQESPINIKMNEISKWTDE